jgi:hypothetical protein
LPLVLLSALMWAAAPASVAGAEDVHRSEEVPQSPRSCFDPIFYWIGANIKEPSSVVLAPDEENTCIPAYSASANVVSLRGGSVLGVRPALERRVPGGIEVPQGAVDVRRFYSGASLEKGVQILRRYEVDYVLVRAGSPLEGQLGHLPGFAAVDAPRERYNLYAVDHQRLGG